MVIDVKLVGVKGLKIVIETCFEEEEESRFPMDFDGVCVEYYL